MISRGAFEHAFETAREANRVEGLADPRPSSIDLAAQLRRIGWTGTKRDARLLAEAFGVRLADSD